MIARLNFPVAKNDDDDDVAWALSTAQVQWKRGSQADAVVWLRRAIDSAVSVGATWRAAELTRQTDELEAALVGPAAVSTTVDEFDGTDMIDDEALSLPPDANMAEALRTPLHADATDERTDVTPVEEQPAEVEPEDEVEVEPEEEIEPEDEVEVEPEEEVEPEDEVVEIDEVEIDEDDISEDELDEPVRPRFESEAPTATMANPGFRLPYELDPESEVPDTVSEPVPETRSEPPPPVEQAAQPSEVAPATPDPEPSPEPELASRPDPEFASEPEAQPEPELPPPSVQTEPFVAGISLAEIRGFEDFPPETQLELSKAARVERLATDDEVSGFGLALVLRGAVNVMPAIADAACGAATERELIYGRGTLTDGVALRLVATAPDTQVAIWDFAAIEPPLADCPWVLEELQAVADRYQALAGVAMGPMGERLDDSLRAMVLSRCKLVKLLPGELLVEKGKPVGGLFIVGAGRLELGTDTARPGSEGHLGPGDFLFAQSILTAGSAPTAARAGASGALLMAADRHAAHELMLSVPPLLELLAG